MLFFEHDPHHAVVAGDGAVAICPSAGDAGGDAGSWRTAGVCHVSCGGFVARFAHARGDDAGGVFADGRRCVCQYVGIRRAGIRGLRLAVFRDGGIFVAESGRGDFVAAAG